MNLERTITYGAIFLVSGLLFIYALELHRLPVIHPSPSQPLFPTTVVATARPKPAVGEVANNQELAQYEVTLAQNAMSKTNSPQTWRNPEQIANLQQVAQYEATLPLLTLPAKP